MQVQASKKTMLLMTAVVAAVVLVLLAYLGVSVWRTRDYQRAKGTITAVDKGYDQHNTGENTAVYRITFAYQAQGRTCQSFYTDLTRWGARPGRHITVYYDPSRPDEVRPRMATPLAALLGSVVILAGFVALTVKAQ